MDGSNGGGERQGVAAAGSRQIVLAALCANAGLAAAKFVAALATGSSAMLAEAVHSLIDACNQALLAFGLARSTVAPGGGRAAAHPRELYFWSFVVAILMFSMGAGVALYDVADKLAHPTALKEQQTGYLVLAVALVAQICVVYAALRRFDAVRQGKPLLAALRASKDPSIFTVLLEATAAIAGVVVAAAGIAASDLGGMPQADGGAAIAIGLILALVAAFCAIEVKGLLTRGDGASEGAKTLPAHEPATVMQPAAAVQMAATPTPTAAAVIAATPAQPAGKPQLAPKQGQGKKGRRKRR